MADDDRTITEEAHIALMTHAVATETKALAAEKVALETKVSELAVKVDVLEAEKAALETKVSEVQAEFDKHKAETARAAEIETAKAARVTAIKAANDKLPAEYFTDERVLAWAQMTEDNFSAVLDGITAAGGATPKTRETAAFGGGMTPTDPKAAPVQVGKFLNLRNRI